jgi:hypothetical protein
MAWRRIGQEDLIARPVRCSGILPLELAALLGRAETDGSLAGLAAAKGEPGWPPPALFRAPAP